MKTATCPKCFETFDLVDPKGRVYCPACGHKFSLGIKRGGRKHWNPKGKNRKRAEKLARIDEVMQKYRRK